MKSALKRVRDRLTRMILIRANSLAVPAKFIKIQVKRWIALSTNEMKENLILATARSIRCRASPAAVSLTKMMNLR